MTEQGGSAGPLRLSKDEVLDAVSDALVALDRDWRYVYVNSQAAQLFGRRPEDLLGRHIWTEFPEAVREPYQQAYELALAEQRQVLVEDYIGAWDRWFECRIHPLPDGVVIFFHEITERKKAEHARAVETQEHKDSRALLDTLIDAAPVGLAYVDASGVYRRVNPALAAMNGRPVEEHLGVHVAEVLPDVDPVAITSIDRVLRHGVPVLGVEVLGSTAAHDGARRQWVSDYYPVRVPGEAAGDVLGAGIAVRDVTEQRRTESLLVERATRDPLTGLPNRAVFLDRLGHAVARRSGGHLAVLFLDLDRFKVVNDSLGHAAGDELLRAVAARIVATVRAEDTVARLGGDEFAVLCERVDDVGDAIRRGERLLQALAAPLDGSPALHVDASVGIAVADRHGHADAVTLLRDADTAMYQAKADGRRRVRVFEEGLRERAVARHSLERRLRTALAADQLQVHYQPVVDLRSGRVVSVEALARWDDAELGSVGPEDFIAVAEDSGLIHTLGAFVLSTACAQRAEWARVLGPAAPRVAVNVSPHQLLRGSALVRQVSDSLGRHGVQAGALCLEITESSVIAETEACTRAVRELHALGVEMAVDDFGTGYSSLSYLTRLPVSVVKADRSFVSAITDDLESIHIVRAVVGLAHGLGLRTVAEGAEHESQVDELVRMGCDQAQGYLFSRALPADDLQDVLTHSFW
ncbi:PAS domain S-box-containing protein/diguanylate cyclase (GGDEF)-like protein [Motilibacter peucedani]|uniref:PAS domain S-box-containing protein/diguanylate cyclase (GGDEF)-like protein n=1 Tax=Motilibacter peucedani TaxID=598650 RepID=A0A420XR62_9ACTN|nr:GGDEF and EAL domain-containing protein [Motilibacter peucedani]RKS77344.1 PAS domain S-box-containing protein/diguanylate cyclase (GGDEF)-like protein [Motilibacter peucedani]